jgi:hypothetical protein
MEDGALRRDQLIAQIRFALSQLPAHNGHHEFEEACRHLAYLRIAPNVVPATGPVSSGGDQGRDFETFHSYIAETLGRHGWFAGLVPAGPIAGICTLQSGSVAGKVLNDVGTICKSGQHPEKVVAFLGVDMPVAQRHDTVEKARQRHGVKLEILDANAISEQLAEHDTYWIAVSYLSLPEHYAPPRPSSEGPDEPEWYVELRAEWRKREDGPRSLAELFAVRDGLRRATFNPSTRHDLAFWLELVRPLAENGPDEDLRQRARYEVVVATIRALGDMRTADAFADAFLSDASAESDPARLEDAWVVLSYASTAASLGHSDLDLAMLSERRVLLRGRAAELLAQNPPRVRRSRLLQVAGRLALVPDAARLTATTGGSPASQVTMLDGPREPVPSEAGEALREIADVDEALAYWTELARLIPDTPLFPVEDFAEIVQYLAPALIDADGWRELVTAVDAAVSRVAGGGRAGEMCRDRAVVLRDNGRPLDALHELHRARVEWWTGDTLRGALLAMLFIAQLYRDLKLPMAAKQYALGAAGAAQSVGAEDVADLVPTGMLLAADISYQAGDWLTALEELEIGVIAMHALGQEEKPVAVEQAGRAAFNATMCLWGARSLCPELVAHVEDVLERVDLLELASDALDGEEPLTESEWRERSDRDLLGRPFGDAGERYSIRFAALGTRWTLSCDNQYAHVRATQRLAAALQVTLAELAAEDLCLLATDVGVSVSASAVPPDDVDRRVVAVPSNDGRRWEVELTDYESVDRTQESDETGRELQVTITRFLIDVSLLPLDDYFAVIDRALESGLSHKLVAGRPYDELAEIVLPDRFESTDRRRYRPPLTGDAPPPIEHPALAWQSGLGPGFSPEKAEQMATNRYEMITSVLPNTLPALTRAAEFQAVLAALRADGWLDWHIMTAIFNVAINYRLHEAALDTPEVVSTAAGREAWERAARTPEMDHGDPIPIEEFNAGALRQGRLMGIVPLLVHWHLAPRQRTPDYPAMEQLLASRYGYWSIDAEHTDPFSAQPAVSKPAQ